MKTITLNDGQWKGSLMTAQMVSNEIAQRWGEEAAKEYDPRTNCLTLKSWNARGYRVRKGEHGIKSITFITKATLDEETGKTEETSKYPKAVYLFWRDQVERDERAEKGVLDNVNS